METRTSNPPEPAGAPVRTRSVAREGAAIPLPSGPLGHLRGMAPDDAARTTAARTTAADTGFAALAGGAGASDAEPATRPWGRWLIPVVAVACIALGVIIGVMVSLMQATDANQARIDAERAQEQVVADRAELDTLRANLDEQKKKLTERENDLVAREDAVSRKESDLKIQQSQLDERQTQLDEAEQQSQNQSNTSQRDTGQWDTSQWVPDVRSTQGSGRNRG